jgi:hypothetical protein
VLVTAAAGGVGIAAVQIAKGANFGLATTIKLMAIFILLLQLSVLA